MADIASTVVEIRPKTQTSTKTATTVHTCQAGQGGAPPRNDVERDKTTKNRGIDDAVNSTKHQDGFKTSNPPSSGAQHGDGGLNRAASTAACGGTSGGGGGQERRKGFARGGSFGGLACWAWVVPWVLLVLGGVEGVKGVAIPDCTYAVYGSGCTDASCYNARTCGIRQAVDTYTTQATIDKYGPIEDWDTSLVTDMSWVFRDKSTFNANISAWQVGKVTDMQRSTYTLFLPSPRSGLFMGLFMAVSMSFLHSLCQH